MKRLPWGHKSRSCIRCGKVGPRCIVAGGYSHKHCMDRDERKKYDKRIAGIVVHQDARDPQGGRG